MKIKIISIFLLGIILSNCSLFNASIKDADETAAMTADSTTVQQEEEKKKASDKSIQNKALSPQQTQVSNVQARTYSSSRDKDHLISELTFDIKKLSAEVKHLKSELEDLHARSQMWTNPLDIYDKEIITKNGTSIFGKIIYQDDKTIKVETLIGYMVLQKKEVVRVITNVPEKPAEQYAPEEVAVDMQSDQTNSAVPTNYISRTEVTSAIPPKSTKKANCVLVGNIKEKKDRSGNTIFSGEVKNIGNLRSDFVKINFVFRKNWSGDTETKTAFIEGSHIVFENSGITSDNSLLPGATGIFKLIIQKSFGSFIGYSYNIGWEQYKQ